MGRRCRRMRSWLRMSRSRLGSKVALHTALAYPDLFHGALLNAGADPIELAAADLAREAWLLCSWAP